MNRKVPADYLFHLNDLDPPKVRNTNRETDTYTHTHCTKIFPNPYTPEAIFKQINLPPYVIRLCKRLGLFGRTSCVLKLPCGSSCPIKVWKDCHFCLRIVFESEWNYEYKIVTAWLRHWKSSKNNVSKKTCFVGKDKPILYNKTKLWSSIFLKRNIKW